MHQAYIHAEVQVMMSSCPTNHAQVLSGIRVIVSQTEPRLCSHMQCSMRHAYIHVEVQVMMSRCSVNPPLHPVDPMSSFLGLYLMLDLNVHAHGVVRAYILSWVAD